MARAPISFLQWLESLTPETMQKMSFPLRKLLRNSLYYPACHDDGRPVKYLAGRNKTGNILSFVYVDYGVSREDLTETLLNEDRKFRGYTLVGMRDVSERELTPHGWHPIPPEGEDGDPARHRDLIKEPYCVWAIFKREQGLTEVHGPARFSLLYLCADGVAAFQALYIANGFAPRAIAIIQPGHGFGGNWTDFTDLEKILARSVLQYNPAGQPEFLDYGWNHPRGFDIEACWPGYDLPVYVPRPGPGGPIRVWRHRDAFFPL